MVGIYFDYEKYKKVYDLMERGEKARDALRDGNLIRDKPTSGKGAQMRALPVRIAPNLTIRELACMDALSNPCPVWCNTGGSEFKRLQLAA